MPFANGRLQLIESPPVARSSIGALVVEISTQLEVRPAGGLLRPPSHVTKAKTEIHAKITTEANEIQPKHH